MPVEKQVLTIYATTSGVLDEFEVEDCLAFEAEMFRYLESSHPDLVAKLGEKAGLTDEIKQALDAAMAECKAS